MISYSPFLHRMSGDSSSWFESWLRDLSLDEYSPLLSQHNLNTPSALNGVTREHLKAIGITKLGHLNRLLKAIQLLKDAQSVTAPSPAAATNTDDASTGPPPNPSDNGAAPFSQPVSVQRPPSMSSNGSLPTAGPQSLVVPPVPMRRSVKRNTSSGGLVPLTTPSDQTTPTNPSLSPKPMKRTRSLIKPVEGTGQTGINKGATLPVQRSTQVGVVKEELGGANSEPKPDLPEVLSIEESPPLPPPPLSNSRSGSLAPAPRGANRYVNIGPRGTQTLPNRVSVSSKGDLTPPPPPRRSSSIKDQTRNSISSIPPQEPIKEETTDHVTNVPTDVPQLPPKAVPLSQYPPSLQPQVESWDDLLKGDISNKTTPTTTDPSIDILASLPPLLEVDMSLPPPPPLSELPPDPPISAPPTTSPPPLPSNDNDTNTSPPPPLPSDDHHNGIITDTSSLSPPPPLPSDAPPTSPPLSPDPLPPVPAQAPPPIPRRVVHSLPPPPPPPITDDDYPQEEVVTVTSPISDSSITLGSDTPDSVATPTQRLRIVQSPFIKDDDEINIALSPQSGCTSSSPTPQSEDDEYLDMELDDPLAPPPLSSPTSELYEPIETPSEVVTNEVGIVNDKVDVANNEPISHNIKPVPPLPPRTAQAPPTLPPPPLPPSSSADEYEPLDEPQEPILPGPDTYEPMELTETTPPTAGDTYEPFDQPPPTLHQTPPTIDQAPPTLPPRISKVPDLPPPPLPPPVAPPPSPPLQSDNTYESIDTKRTVETPPTLPPRPVSEAPPPIVPIADSTYEAIDSKPYDRDIDVGGATPPSLPPPRSAVTPPTAVVTPPIAVVTPPPGGEYEAIDFKPLDQGDQGPKKGPAPPPLPVRSANTQLSSPSRLSTVHEVAAGNEGGVAPVGVASGTLTYEVIDTDTPRRLPPPPAPPPSSTYETVISDTPSTPPFSTTAPPLKTMSSPSRSSGLFTQSYPEGGGGADTTDGLSPLRRFTDNKKPARGKGQFMSVKDLAKDLEKKEMEKQIKSALSESDVINIRADETISPAASRALSILGVPPTKEGYLFKKGGKRNDKPYQRRWVVFDGEDLKYFKAKGEKESDARNNVKLSEMIDIKRVSDPDHNSRFDLVVINRVFQFYADNDDEAQLWVSVLHAAISKYNPQDEQSCKVGGNMNEPDKEGFIMKQGHGRFAGFRQRYVALKGAKFAYYDSKEDFVQGKPIHVLDMRLAMVKPEAGGKSRFTITMPNQRSYIFQASNEANRMEWIEKLSNAILTGLNLAPEQKEGKKGVRAADILERIQKNPSNKKCADCGDEDPSWGVVNRGIMVCIECSGVHRAMGVHISKVRSVELDTEIWTDTLINLMVTIGNYSANLFWERHFKGERIPTDCPREIRESFIRSKYESKSWVPDNALADQEELNMALCSAVIDDDLMLTTELLVKGANPCCNVKDSSDPELNTPLAIARSNSQPLQVELLEQNGALVDINNDSSIQTISKRGYLHKTGSERLGWKRRYCTIDNFRGLEYFKTDTDPEILGNIGVNDILGVCQCEDEVNGRGHCFEVITAARAYLFSADTDTDMSDWISVVRQVIPNDAGDKLGYDKIGFLKKKSLKNVTWQRRWFALKDRKLSYFKKGQGEVTSIDLRTVTELKGHSSDPSANLDQQCTVHIVTHERSYTLRADNPNEADQWLQALKQTQMSVQLSEHPVISSGNIPIIVHKCLQFVEISGLKTEGLYRKSGEHSKIRKLLLAFNQDPRGVVIDEDSYSVHDVTGTLKQFFRTLPDPLMTHKLYQPFLHASSMTSGHENQMYQLQSLIDQLPDVNRETLKRLIGHLLKVIQHESDNKMSQSNIISLFGPTLMTVDGDAVSFEDSGAQYACINHMLNYYKWLFNVNEDEDKKEEAMQSALLKIQAAQQQHKESTMLMSSSTSFLISIYVTNKEGGACSMKINAQTTAAEVVEFVTTTKCLPKRNYALFLVLGDAESERPLHSLELVLAVQKPDSYLCIKPNTFADKLLPFDGIYKGQTVSIHVQEKKKWRKCPCRVRDNMFLIYKDAKAHNELARLALSDLDVFVGIEQKRIDVRNPLPTRYPFCLLVRFEEQNKFLCADSADDRLLLLAAIIFAKFPDGIQTPLMPVKTTPTHFDSRNRGISILNPTQSSPHTSPTHGMNLSVSYNPQPVIPRGVVSPSKVGTLDHSVISELKKRNSLSPDHLLS
ncbi:PREDICTED: arf-GAP with Rho-GAP domain, ANK repeat and PH domain-containing protein 1-like isoform X1 [Amphimedon queenslandica]|uniref:Arf-GAP with Rho-GAP domain, ANK repeat and PH domain-containing protein 1 n=4 Tax=Amphimedon queenslandica TaxID=400682 RepID=A0AAN0JFC7_AMPQE|nr:PREDICTED: arf-GAP with Rho-GAP domain, ANK repeat and PH domain-containing protein 1-like isoform X1 [Amphimedon queenslandica]|eukprot:XP_019855674.1 PREDICTED: arf-GAP with Rho-GAP domain, ANK repeat and PH domain-containing protein 1-like isoform X1 [Amphimedon queenslandica]